MRTKRHLLALLALAGLGLTAHAQTTATDWPNKPIRWVVPFPPGGADGLLVIHLAQPQLGHGGRGAPAR